MADTLYLIDGSGFLFRAFHALPQLTNAQGEPTGVIYGVTSMLKSLLREQQPTHVAAIFDASGKTFRDDMYDQYKANRPPMPEDLRSQIEPIMDITEALGFPLLRVPGVEADDVIATLTRQARAQGMSVFIASADKDLAQLVDDDTLLVDAMRNSQLNPNGVTEKFGVPPEKIGDYLALIGDKADNIPGIHKCGPKTAVKWLDAYGDLDGVIAHANEVGGKIGEYLRDGLDQLKLSRELVALKEDVELDYGPTDLTLNPPDEKALRDAYRHWQFNTWLEELDDDSDLDVDYEYDTILSEDDLHAWVKKLQKVERFAVDTETTSLDPHTCDLVGISLAVAKDDACYIPVAHDYPGAPQQLSWDTVREALKPLLENPDVDKIGQHIKYDLNVLQRHGITLEGVRFDTMLESYVHNPTGSRHDMDSLARLYLGRNTVSFTDIAGKGAKQLTFNQIDLETAAHYAAEDAAVTYELHETLWPKIEQEPALKKIFCDIEMPLVPVLAKIERRGVLIDTDMLAKQSAELKASIADLEEKAFAEAGESFNLASPSQLQKILFEKMELPVLRKTPKGAPSTAEDVLSQLALDYPLPSLILKHRSLSKLRSTYTEKLPREIKASTGRVHTDYHQAVAATGRLSSTNPNLQNIPIRTEEGRRIRKAFIPPKGCKMLAADYSQIELRIMAHLSGDKGLTEAFAHGQDVHSSTAAEVFGTSMDAVTSEQRRAAKAINFGLIYGMSAFGLGRQLDLDRNQAQAYIDRYFDRYPGVHDFMEATRKQAREKGYVETVFGRRLHLQDINASNHARRQAAERAAINAPMQGTAADIIKRAMIDIDQWLCQQDDAPAHVVMQVHDELVLEVRDSAVETISDAVKSRMETAAELRVPLVVEVGVGNNWDEAH